MILSFILGIIGGAAIGVIVMALVAMGKEWQWYGGGWVSIRETYMSDYGLSSSDTDKIVKFCRSATGHDQEVILQAAQAVYPEIAPYLFLNLTTGMGYDNISKACHIPLQRKDFQGYRRKTIETYNRYMICNGKQILWKYQHYILRYDYLWYIIIVSHLLDAMGCGSASDSGGHGLK